MLARGVGAAENGLRKPEGQREEDQADGHRPGVAQAEEGQRVDGARNRAKQITKSTMLPPSLFSFCGVRTYSRLDAESWLDGLIWLDICSSSAPRGVICGGSRFRSVSG